MKRATCILSMLGSWAMVIIHYLIEMMLGARLDVILVTALVTFVVGLCLGYINGRETEKEEI